MSHPLPWLRIILELLALLWCLARSRDRRAGDVGVSAVLALLFVTSEMFFVAVPAVFAALPFLLWPVLRPDRMAPASSATGDPERTWMRTSGPWRNQGTVYAATPSTIGATSCGPGWWELWCFSLSRARSGRAAWQAIDQDAASLHHDAPLGVVSGQRREPYIHDRAEMVLRILVLERLQAVSRRFALGIPGLIGLAIARKLPLSTAPLLSMTVFLLFAAHRAHIIGPEYLAHCLPFLTLLGGMAVYGLSLLRRPLAPIALLVLAVPFARYALLESGLGGWSLATAAFVARLSPIPQWQPRVPLPGMDQRAQVSRWPDAARFLGSHWHAGDKVMVGSTPVPIAHWYLVYVGGVSPINSQFQPMPIHAPKPEFLHRLAIGFYRYVAVSNMFEDKVALDEKTARILRSWPVAWRSDERGTGPSRLIVYRAPEGLPAKSPVAHRPMVRKR